MSSLDRNLLSDAISSLDLSDPAIWSASIPVSPYVNELDIPFLNVLEHPLLFHHINAGHCGGTGDRVSGIRSTLDRW